MRQSGAPDDGSARSSAAGAQTFLDAIPLPACLTDARGEVLSANARWHEVFGPHAEASGSASPITDCADKLRRIARQGARGDLEVSVQAADGYPRWFSGRCALTDHQDESAAAMICVVLEVTEFRRREAQLSFMATHDALTGLPNRRMFEDSLVRALARARRDAKGALIMLDIDNLKAYNDSLGHSRGDQAIINFALLLRTHVRAGDMLARLGGDEFGVILEGATLDEAVEICERMRAAAAGETFVAEARSFDLGLSAGVVPFDGTEEAMPLCDAADEALYEAKNAGRNRVVVRSAGLSAKAEGDPG